MYIRKRTFLSFLVLVTLLVIPLGSALAGPKYPVVIPPANGHQPEDQIVSNGRPAFAGYQANRANSPAYPRNRVVPKKATPPRQVYPEVIPLPDGFRPEGIVIGLGHTFYVGSLANGAIYQGDLRTGEGSLLFEGETGRVAVGLGFDPRSGYLFVSGGPTGYAYVYDTRTGEEVASYQLSTTDSFINDVIVTRQAAYFTNSFEAVIYRLPLGPRGSLPDASDVEAISLIGDWEQAPNAFNANGIEATQNGKYLIVVNSVVGKLYLVDPDSGEATEISLEGGDVTNGDGLVLRGKTLFVVQNQLNQVAIIQLSPDLLSGEIVRVISDPDFRIPTTADIFQDALYVVNARFDVTPEPDTEYEVVRVPLTYPQP